MWEKIQQSIGWIQMALSIVPQIIALVKAVELPGNGPAKLAAVIEIVKAAYAMIPPELAQAIGIEKVEAFVTKVVSVVVALLNKAKVFESSKS